MFPLSLFPFLYKYFLELSIFLVPEQATAGLETVLILDALCPARYNSLSQAVITTSQIPPLLLQRPNDLCPTSLLPALSLSTHNIEANETDGFMGMVGPFKFWDNKTINKGPFFNALSEMKEIGSKIC